VGIPEVLAFSAFIAAVEADGLEDFGELRVDVLAVQIVVAAAVFAKQCVDVEWHVGVSLWVGDCIARGGCRLSAVGLWPLAVGFRLSAGGSGSVAFWDNRWP